MDYRITLSSNPKIYLMIALIVILPAIGIATFFFVPPLLAVLITVVGGYISYVLFKYVRRILRSRVSTNDDSIVFDMGRDEKATIEWEDITYAGIAVERLAGPHIFVYAEETDQLMTIPDEFEGFSELAEELRERLNFEEVRLDEGETIQEFLRMRIQPTLFTQPDTDETPETE